MTDSTAVEIARFDERLNAIERMLADIRQDLIAAAEGRRRGYEAQERVECEMIGITHRLGSVEKSVESIRPTTAELERVRDRVIFASSLGKAMWSIGKALLAVAAGAASTWYAMTGRPPP